MQSLDIRTLSFVAMLTSLLLALGLQLVNRIIAKDPSLRLWTLGATANSAGFVLLSMRGVVPELFSIIVGNTSLLAGAVWIYLGNLRFQEEQSEPPWYWFVVAGAASALSYFVYVVPDLTTRIVISSAATAAILFPSGFVLLNHGDNHNRVVRWVIATAFLATALFFGVRAIVTPFLASMGEDLMTVISPVQALPFVLAIVMSLVLGIGLPLLVSGRMQRRLVESEIQLQAILESTADGILAVDRDGKILRANKTFAEMWQIPQSLLHSKDDKVLLNYVLSNLHDPDTFLTKVHALYQSDADATDTLRFKDGRVYERNSSALILNHAVLGRVWSFRDVTKRMQAQEALNASELRFRRLTQLSSDWYWEQDENCRFTFSSSGVDAQMRGVGEHIGKTRWELPHIDTDPEVIRENDALLAARKPFKGLVIKRMGRDNTVRYAQISGEPVFDEQGQFRGYRGVGSDVTEIKLNQQRIARSEQRMEFALAGAGLGMWDLDIPKGSFSHNPRLVAMLGYAPNEITMTAEALIPLLHPDDAPAFGAAYYAHLKGETPSLEIEYRVRHKSGQWIWILTRGKVVERDKSDRAIRLTGTNLDITPRKQAEAERAQLEARLRESQKMEALGTLAGGVAHDFNNALATITGNAELARQDVGPNHPALVSLEEISKASRRVKDLVQQILAFGRRQKLERKATSLALVVVETERLIRATLPAGVSLNVDCKANTPAVLADATQVKQILLNLCANATQAIQVHGRTGVIEVKLSAYENTLGKSQDALPSGRYACLTVRDNGPGMDEATRARIFEPFFTTKPVGKGTGLGLAVVHGIVEAHEAFIKVESALGRGSEFRVYFPAIDGSVTETTPVALDATPIHGAGKHVLYVDDDEAIVFLMKRLLERQGFRVSGFTDSREALAAARTNPDQFDLAVTDYNMPGMTGLEVASALRDIRADMPVVLASGYITEELRQKAPAAGVRELIYKPNSVDDLCEAVARYANAQGKISSGAIFSV